ncbi:MAG: hypothetical protein LW711_14530 [Saprospiraceae bacterium]|jgi:hypothetical protein|nr:hypothetical protein [Algoriphagus sp.]MCE2771202.1 hypothetical protein [Saprospiraceae bacterium]
MKNLFIIGTTLISMFFLASCGSIQSDAKKLAEYECKLKELMQKSMTGDQEAQEEMEKLGKEIAEFGEELEEKYPTDAEKEEVRKAVAEESGKCE